MNISMTEAIPITQNEDMKKVLMFLQNSGVEREKEDIESLVKHIDYMESQFGRVLNELQDVKSQLKAIEDKSVRATAARIVDTVELKFMEAKQQFVSVKENVVKSFSDATQTVKEKGVSALKKTVNFLGIHSALSHLKGKLNQAVASLNQGVSRIEKMKGEIHEAKIHAQNAGRIMVKKNVKEVSAYHSDRGILSGIQKRMSKAGNMLSGISKTVDSAIGKLENPERRDEKKSVREDLKKIKKSRTADQTPAGKSVQDKAR